MEETHAAGRCPRCRRVLPPDAVEGLCPACVLEGALDLTSATLASEAQTVLAAAPGPRVEPSGHNLALVEGQPFGPYRIGRLLGRGGMGEVHEAEHLETGRRVALKILRGALSTAADRARFLREGQLAASVSHPHTVYIYGSEEIAGMPVITMELVPGGTLKGLVGDSGPLPVADAVTAVLDVIGGLDAAQAAGILHRDIKPSNCFRDVDGSIKVGDFGLSISTLARDVGTDAETGGFEGTPQFAAPEQLRGAPLDVRADIYAVGATLHYLLTGAPPFDAPDLRQLVTRVTSEPPPSVRARRPGVPAALDAVIRACLAKDPGERPQTYAALADRLKPFAPGDAVPAGLGLRTLAGVIDLMIVGLPLNLMTAWRVSAEGTDGPVTATTSVGAALLGYAYSLLVEGTTGASLGKRVFGLRVSAVSGHRRFAQMASRATLFAAPSLLMVLAILLLGRETVTETAASRPALGALIGLLPMVLIAAMFATARRGNGYAALHDRASGTRVVSRPRILERRTRRAPESSLRPLTTGAPLRCGPFEIRSDLRGGVEGRLLAGFDPALRRQVWLRIAPDGTPPVHAARRDLSRLGRLHWLAGRRAGGDNWDAFEAPLGAPLVDRAGRSEPAPWRIAKGWLADLLSELRLASADGTLPPLAIDRLWVREDGHLVLLDFPAPGAAEARPVESPMMLLTEAARVLAPRVFARADGPSDVPLSARTLLDRWSAGAAKSLDDAAAELSRVLHTPDAVSPKRRAVAVAMAAAPVVVLSLGAALVLPVFRSAMTPDRFEAYGLLAELRRAGSADSPPDAERAAMATYLAGQHRGILDDARFWSSAVAQGELGRLRPIARQVSASHPVVTTEALAEARLTLEARLGRMKRDYDTNIAPQLAGANATIVIALVGLGLGSAMTASVASAIAAPGGLILQLLGLAVVSRDGRRIGRGRSLARALTAWSPVLAWAVWLGPDALTRSLASPGTHLAAGGATVAIMAIGAVMTVADATRGPAGRVTGTWIVPR